MYVIKGSVQCSCYELRGNEGSLLIEVEHPGGMKEKILTPSSKFDFFIHPRAVSG